MSGGIIPFLLNRSDAVRADEFFPEAAVYRVALPRVSDVVVGLGSADKIWLDPGLDCAGRVTKKSPPAWKQHSKNYPDIARLSEPEFRDQPNKAVVAELVPRLLDGCMEHQPKWLSVPQLPIPDDTSVNRLNRHLADATGKWAAPLKRKPKLILPLVLAKHTIVEKKSGSGHRDEKVSAAVSCYKRSGASGVWVVDSTLDDQAGRRAFEETRLPGLRALHSELRKGLPAGSIMIAGPYWGMNLVLWARGLADCPAIGVGRGFQYHCPGAPVRRAAVRIALAPIRRLVRATPQVQDWLTEAIVKLAEEDPLRADLTAARENLSKVRKALEVGLGDDNELAARQVVRFYRGWLEMISHVAPSSRPHTLFEDLSSAFVAGRILPSLPTTPKDAGLVARQLMLQCL